MNNADKTMDKIVALCKGRGYVYPGSEIYGGLANTWDYGPLGVEFKNNVKKAWWKKFIQESKYNVGLDCAILMNPETWVASGHVGGFSDPLMDCKECKSRHRADKLTLHTKKVRTSQLTVGAKKRWLNTSQKITLSAQNAASKTLLIFVNLTLCSRHSKALQKILHQ